MSSTPNRLAPWQLALALLGGLAAGLVLFLDPGGWHSLDDHLRGDHSTMSNASSGGTAPGDDEILFYRHPMDPTISSPVPAKDSMGMDYIPVRASDRDTGGGAATVRIDPSVAQNMNVRTERAVRRDLQRRIRSVGTLEFDQERMVTVTTKYAGFVEKVYANYVGENVARGAALFEIYSPELVQTQQELLSTVEYARSLADAPEGTRLRAEALVEAARTRLGYWDIGADQIRQVEETGEILRALTVVSPTGGVIMMRQPGLEGMAVRPGLELFHIADLSTLWLSVELFEDQLAWIRQGTEAEISLSYFADRAFTGVVRFIEPEVSAETRTLGAKIEVPNPTRDLRPGMFATILFRPVAAADALVVPSSAVIRTGRRNVVMIEEAPGRFFAREVTLGNQSEGLVQVLSGLAEGDQVVTSAQFLLDSEASVQEAIRRMTPSGQGATKGPGAGDLHAHDPLGHEMPDMDHDMAGSDAAEHTGGPDHEKAADATDHDGHGDG